MHITTPEIAKVSRSWPFRDFKSEFALLLPDMGFSATLHNIYGETVLDKKFRQCLKHGVDLGYGLLQRLQEATQQ